jgi:hypothetical protein
MAYHRNLLNNTALTTTLALGLGISGACAADMVAEPMAAPAPMIATGSLPAVSQLNGKIDISGGGVQPGYDPNNFFVRTQGLSSFDSAFKVRGAVSVPLAHAYGLQLDGVIGQIASKTYGHGAGHLFWRDPAIGLVGGYASWTGWDNVNSYRSGVEGEYYAGRFTASGVLGYEWGDVDNGVFSIEDLSFYANDDFKLSVGHRFSKEIGHSLALGAEYQFLKTRNVGYAAFVDGRVGEKDYQSIFAGIRLYFGQDKSLIRRHREDDPDFHDEPGSVVSCMHAPNSPSMVDSIGEAPLEKSPSLFDSIISPLSVPDVPCNSDYTYLPPD